MKISKKSLLTTSLAVALAAALVVGGGTFAYLQSNTGDVVNRFDANKVVVSLAETTGSEYHIIPGTSQEKDPTVTVDNTVDAYVYAMVMDNTDGLVTYEIADGWLPLDGYDNVYYREVAADAAEKTFDVLKDNIVTYSADLENGDMLDGEGNLKDGMELTFTAYAIQTEGFADVLSAWDQVGPYVSTDEELEAAVAAGEPVVLATDLGITASALNEIGSADVNLNNNELTIAGNQFVQVGDGETFALKNGTVTWDNDNGSYISIRAGEGSAIELENVEMDMGGKSILVDYGTEEARIDVIDSTIYTSDYYCISTNANNPQSGSGIVINVENSTLTAADPNGDCTAILMNVPGTLTITDSEINAGRQAVIVRAGEATITDSVLNNSLAYTQANWAKYDETRWGSGNEVPVAVLVVGDRATAYPYDAACTLSNVTLNYGKVTARAPIYAAAYDGQTATINGVSADSVTVSQDAEGGVIINE